MTYIYNTLNVERLRYLLQLRGIGERDFMKKLCGAQTHRDFDNYFGQKTDLDVKCSTIVKICSILNIPIDSLFIATDINGNIPSVVGNDNIVNSSVVGTDYRTASENEALKMIIKEKDARIEDLKKFNEQLSERINTLFKIGRFSDN